MTLKLDSFHHSKINGILRNKNLEVNWKIYEVKDKIALQVAKVLINYPNLSRIEQNLTHISKMILETKCKWWDPIKRQKYACNDDLFSYGLKGQKCPLRLRDSWMLLNLKKYYHELMGVKMGCLQVPWMECAYA